MRGNASLNSSHKDFSEEKYSFMQLFVRGSKTLLLFALVASFLLSTLVFLHYFEIVPYDVFIVAIVLLTFSLITFVIVSEIVYIIQEFHLPVKSNISSKREIEVLSNEVRRLQQTINELQPDAERYRKILDAGLPICYLGVEYYDKAALDAAIDSTN